MKSFNGYKANPRLHSLSWSYDHRTTFSENPWDWKRTMNDASNPNISVWLRNILCFCFSIHTNCFHDILLREVLNSFLSIIWRLKFLDISWGTQGKEWDIVYLLKILPGSKKDLKWLPADKHLLKIIIVTALFTRDNQ